jgi:hypothetical protein
MNMEKCCTTCLTKEPDRTNFSRQGPSSPTAVTIYRNQRSAMKLHETSVHLTRVGFAMKPFFAGHQLLSEDTLLLV